MAHDRMNDDLDRNMGRSGQEDDLGGGQDFGKQTPGRSGQGQGQQTGQKGAGQKNNPLEDDDFGGQSDQKGGYGGSQSGQGNQGGRMGGQNQ